MSTGGVWNGRQRRETPPLKIIRNIKNSPIPAMFYYFRHKWCIFVHFNSFYTTQKYNAVAKKPDWDILLQCGLQTSCDLLISLVSPNVKPEVDLDAVAAIVKNQQDVITALCIVQFERNLEDRYKMTCHSM